MQPDHSKSNQRSDTLALVLALALCSLQVCPERHAGIPCVGGCACVAGVAAVHAWLCSHAENYSGKRGLKASGVFWRGEEAEFGGIREVGGGFVVLVVVLINVDVGFF